MACEHPAEHGNVERSEAVVQHVDDDPSAIAEASETLERPESSA